MANEKIKKGWSESVRRRGNSHTRPDRQQSGGSATWSAEDGEMVRGRRAGSALARAIPEDDSSSVRELES